METNLIQDFYPFQACLWPWAVAVYHTSTSGRLGQGTLCLGVTGRGQKWPPEGSTGHPFLSFRKLRAFLGGIPEHLGICSLSPFYRWEN